jgi:hypothetical protein
MAIPILVVLCSHSKELGPRSSTLGCRPSCFNDFQDAITTSSPNTPGLHTTIFDSDATSRRRTALPDIARTYSGSSSLCRWAIHIVPIPYEPLPDPPEAEQCNPHDESTWKPWKDTPGDPTFDEIPKGGLESNDFSNLKASDLPIAVPPSCQSCSEII